MSRAPGKKSRATVSVLCFILLLSAQETGCMRSDRAVLQVAVGGAPSELDFWETLAKQFHERTGISVEILRHPTDTDQRRQSLVIPLKAAKNNPDVFLMDVAWISQFAASGWLEPLDVFAAGEAFDLGQFFAPVLRQADQYDGRLIALPVYIDGGLLYYRRDLLEQFSDGLPPRTWDELVRLSRDIQGRLRKDFPDFYAFVWQGAQYEGLICNFLEFAASNGGGLQVENGQIMIHTPQNIEALQFMRDLIHREEVSPPNTYTEMKEEEVRIFFGQGNALFERNWPYAWRLHEKDDPAVAGKIAIALLPHFPGGRSASTLGGWHIAISRYSDLKSEAWEFVKFAVSFDTQKEMALEIGWNPSRVDLYDDPDVLKELPHFTDLKTIFQSAIMRLNVPYYSQVSEILQRYINAVLAAEMPPAEGLLRAEREIRLLVGRYEGKA